MSNSEDNFVRSFAALTTGLIVGAGVIWLSFRDEIRFAEKFGELKQCDEVLQKNGITMPDTAAGVPVINGYLSGLDDYSYCKAADKGAQSNVDAVNSLPTAMGSGFTVGLDNQGAMIFSEVDEEMSAYEQGLRAGDVLLAVDGTEIDPADRHSATSICGKDGTSCALTVLRDGRTVELDFTRTNSKTPEKKYVKTEMMGKTLYIGISSMKYHEALDALNDEKYDSVVLDLRENLGGYTDNALSYAAEFVSEGYYKEHHFDGEEETYSVVNGRKLGVPIVVLVNENTASAAETLTALLKQYGDATIVGTTTYGKGVFQSPYAVGDKVMWCTTGYFTVGRWDCWNGIGIAPDVEVEMDSTLIGTDEDVQLKTALKMLG